MRKNAALVRAWYGGKNPPPPEALAAALAADVEPQLLYDHATGEGEYAGIIKTLYDRMDSLKRNPMEFRTWTEEDGMETFLAVLADFVPPDLRSRVQFLQRVGVFKFRKSDGPEEKKAKISAVFAPPEREEDYRELVRRQANRLAGIWEPRANTLLAFIIGHPAQVGRLLADRLNPANGRSLKIIGHLFAEVRSAVLQPLADSKTVAYERESEIHLVVAVRPVLERWDQDAASSGCAQFTLFEALLLHEIVEVLLDETEPQVEPLDAHVIASSFERYLKGEMLNVAVEDFFLQWPPLSSAEIAERQQSELAKQLEEMSVFLGENIVPELEEEDLEDLPLDQEMLQSSQKKVSAKKKIARPREGKKILRTGIGSGKSDRSK